MPRIRQYAEKYQAEDFSGEVRAQVARKGLNQYKMSMVFGVTPATMSKYLTSPDTIRMGMLRRMVKELKLDPVVVMKALGYTSQDIKRIGRSTDES